MAARGVYAVRAGALESGRGRRFTVDAGTEPVTWRAALDRWQSDAAFRAAFVDALRTDVHTAFFFETPPVSAAVLERAFEWVLVDAPGLATVAADARPFREHLAGRTGVHTFANLGGDATLVAPCTGADPRHYAHLAAFVRGAPDEQVHELWRAVGRAVEERLERSPARFWVSTSGLGVYWTHVRIDERPKYYTYAPYRV